MYYIVPIISKFRVYLRLTGEHVQNVKIQLRLVLSIQNGANLTCLLRLCSLIVMASVHAEESLSISRMFSRTSPHLVVQGNLGAVDCIRKLQFIKGAKSEFS